MNQPKNHEDSDAEGNRNQHPESSPANIIEARALDFLRQQTENGSLTFERYNLLVDNYPIVCNSLLRISSPGSILPSYNGGVG